MITSISAREKQVLDLISHGLTTNQIASNLFLSSHTVISHRKKLLIKLDANNTAGMVRRAFEQGIIHLH